MTNCIAGKVEVRAQGTSGTTLEVIDQRLAQLQDDASDAAQAERDYLERLREKKLAQLP